MEHYHKHSVVYGTVITAYEKAVKGRVVEQVIGTVVLIFTLLFTIVLKLGAFGLYFM